MLRQPKIIGLHDFYVDKYILDLDSQKLEELAHKGGNLRLPMRSRLGGYAASAIDGLSKMGAETTLITRVDTEGHVKLEEWLKETDLSYVKQDGVSGESIVMEVNNGLDGLVKIMLDNEEDSNFNFSPLDLTQEDREKIRESDYVLVANWGANYFGTELLKEASLIAKEGNTLIYFEAGDISQKKTHEITELIDAIKESKVDFWAMNEEEVTQFVNATQTEDLYYSSHSLTRDPINSPIEAAEILQKMLPETAILMHTKDYAWMNQDIIPTYEVVENRTTGAGDTWNAGFIYAHAMNAKGRYIVKFANAAAGFFVENEYRPSFEETKNFVRDRRERLKPQTMALPETSELTNYSNMMPTQLDSLDTF